MSDVLLQALLLAARGVPVFFCNSDKSPAAPKHFYKATTDADALAQMYRLRPGPLLGVPTGRTSGFDVLDVDMDERTADAWLAANEEYFPETRVHSTPSGLQYFFRHAVGVRNSASRFPRGVNTLGDGDYMIWWPSDDFPAYCDAAIAEWPPRLLAGMLPRSRRVPKPIIDRSVDNRRLAGLVTAVAQAAPGEVNSALFFAVWCLAGRPFDGIFAIEALIEAAVRAGLPPVVAWTTAREALVRAQMRNINKLVK